MIVLTIRTDNPDAELALFDDTKQLASEVWPAHRQLAETIHTKIVELLKRQGKTLNDLNGIVCFKGPGSFTGLRIGLTVGNALADGLDIPIVATAGENWTEVGVQRLQAGNNDRIALPDYGAPVNITTQKK